MIAWPIRTDHALVTTAERTAAGIGMFVEAAEVPAPARLSAKHLAHQLADFRRGQVDRHLVEYLLRQAIIDCRRVRRHDRTRCGRVERFGEH